MFESDDFDQVLSQFDLPEANISSQAKPDINPAKTDTNNDDKRHHSEIGSVLECDTALSNNANTEQLDLCNITSSTIAKDIEMKPPPLSPTNKSKRRLISSLFNSKAKRKFPGPAGLLTGSLEQSNDENICQLELLSQDVDYSQNLTRKDIFESPLWNTLMEDTSNQTISSIQSIKQQALAGHLRHRKAGTIVAYVEAVDRSATDPLMVLRDTTESIKCTLHRDAWLQFAPYISSEYCAIVLMKPTVLTTGGSYKKHYLNITLGNVFALYSSAVLDDESYCLPEGYSKKQFHDFTVIKAEAVYNTSDNFNSKTDKSNEDDLLDGLDGSIFLDDIF